jgi:hypothetical protein
MLEADNTDAATLKALKLAYERRGWKAFWREEIQRNSRADSYFVALAYAKIGDKKQALEVLQRVISRREVRVLWMGSDPQLDSLRSDPRFQKLLQGVGLVSRQNPT